MASLVDLLVQLMNIDSSTGHEGPLAHFVAAFLAERGWSVELQPLADNSERVNVFATRLPADSEKVPRLLFNTHLDTVAPFIPPSIVGERVLGRGSNDAKGQLACMIWAAETAIKEHPELTEDIGLLFVVGEELDHVGMTRANDLRRFAPEFLIVGEPTELKFASLQKGALKVTLRVQGKAAHSGYPHMGKSAVHALVRILHEILEADWPCNEQHGSTDINVGFIKGGQALNALAAEAEASLFFRVMTSVADIRQRLEAIVGDRAVLDFSFGGNEPQPLDLPPFEVETAAVAFNTDVAFCTRRPPRVFLFGAGSITNAHSLDEFVLIADLEEATRQHIRLVESLLLSPV